MVHAHLLFFPRTRTFIFAGIDTTSHTAARLLHLLALNPDVQNRLRAEIVEVQAGQEISYDRLNNLPFLEAVCRETLRLYVSRAAQKQQHSPAHI